MGNLDKEVDAMRQGLEEHGRKQAEDKWQARVDELRRKREQEEADGVPSDQH